MCKKNNRILRNPVAVATIIDLIHWYSQGSSPKTKLERAVLQGLSKTDPDRSVSQRMVENFSTISSKHKTPIFGRFVPGKLRAIPENELKQAFTRPQRTFLIEDDVSLGDPPQFPPDTQFTIDYMGIYCKERTGDRFFSPSDEPYVITVSVSTEGGTNVERSELHPFGDPDKRYGDVDDGESRKGPIAVCWAGVEPVREISIVTSVIEHDEGDQDAYRDEIETVVNAIAEIAILYGVSIPESIQSLAVDVFTWLSGSSDDEIGTQVVILTPAWIRRWAALPTRKFSEKRIVKKPKGFMTYVEEEVTDNTDIDFHFASRHTKDGEYVVLYRVSADKEPLTPLPGSNLPAINQEVFVVEH